MGIAYSDQLAHLHITVHETSLKRQSLSQAKS